MVRRKIQGLAVTNRVSRHGAAATAEVGAEIRRKGLARAPRAL
jgi:hypothetical protein|nr:hypothetical protein [Altererythrobacter segetis]